MIAVQLLTAENGKGVSPQKIALNCHGYPRIEQIFTIVVFKRYQLITPGRPRCVSSRVLFFRSTPTSGLRANGHWGWVYRYKSDTAVVHEVRDLRKDTDSEPTRLAIKLMRDEPSWVRELQLRSLSYGATADVVAVKVAATLAPSINFQSRVPVDCYPGLVESVRLTQTADLLREFPFALIMPMVRYHPSIPTFWKVSAPGVSFCRILDLCALNSLGLFRGFSHLSRSADLLTLLLTGRSQPCGGGAKRTAGGGAARCDPAGLLRLPFSTVLSIPFLSLSGKLAFTPLLNPLWPAGGIPDWDGHPRLAPGWHCPWRHQAPEHHPGRCKLLEADRSRHVLRLAQGVLHFSTSALLPALNSRTPLLHPLCCTLRAHHAAWTCFHCALLAAASWALIHAPPLNSLVRCDLQGGAPGQQSSFSVRSGDSDLFEMISIDGPRLNLASPDKVWGSSAYQCPELLAYAQAAQSNDALLAVDELLSTAFRIDFWSFGATLYEIATGLPLFEHQCATLLPPLAAHACPRLAHNVLS